ncbi:unnamed protein product [Ectocarpus sp. 12 AP-2014]
MTATTTPETANNRDDDEGAVRSTLYSLHVVEDGCEVRLGGVFVWGWCVKGR